MYKLFHQPPGRPTPRHTIRACTVFATNIVLSDEQKWGLGNSPPIRRVKESNDGAVAEVFGSDSDSESEWVDDDDESESAWEDDDDV